jgi:hypothetical protein
VALKVASGTFVQDAIKEVGIANPTYYAWKKNAAKPSLKKLRLKGEKLVDQLVEQTKSTTPFNFHIPADESQLVILIGKSADLNQALAKLAEIRR